MHDTSVGCVASAKACTCCYGFGMIAMVSTLLCIRAPVCTACCISPTHLSQLANSNPPAVPYLYLRMCVCCLPQAKDALFVMEGRLSGTLLGVAAIPSLPLSCEVRHTHHAAALQHQNLLPALLQHLRSASCCIKPIMCSNDMPSTSFTAASMVCWVW
jgi:hypothetical protein